MHPEVQTGWLSCCLVGGMKIWFVTPFALAECKYNFSFSSLMLILTNPTGLETAHLYDWLEFGYWALKSLERRTLRGSIVKPSFSKNQVLRRKQTSKHHLNAIICGNKMNKLCVWYYIYFYSLSSFPHLVCLVIWETVGRSWCKIIFGDSHVIDTLWYTGCSVQAAWNQRLKLVRS